MGSEYFLYIENVWHNTAFVCPTLCRALTLIWTRDGSCHKAQQLEVGGNDVMKSLPTTSRGPILGQMFP